MKLFHSEISLFIYFSYILQIHEKFKKPIGYRTSKQNKKNIYFS